MGRKVKDLPIIPIDGSTTLVATGSNGTGRVSSIKQAENVFPVLRSSYAAGKFETPEYDVQLAQALAGLAPFPSVYAARDAAFAWLQANPNSRAVMVVLSGHKVVRGRR
jgi:hypothetical protein